MDDDYNVASYYGTRDQLISAAKSLCQLLESFQTRCEVAHLSSAGLLLSWRVVNKKRILHIGLASFMSRKFCFCRDICIYCSLMRIYGA